MTPGQVRALDTAWEDFGIEFGPGPLDLDDLFKRCAPRILEIGFGNGDALLEAATSDPARDHIGIEVHRPGVGSLLRRAQAAGVRNLRVSMHDAVEVLHEQIPRNSLDEVRLFFPDPWPKKRHHKRRIVQSDFVVLVADRLVAGGRFHLATDWAEYAEWMLELLRGCPVLENTAPDGGFVSRPATRPATRFERRGLNRGHEVFDIIFRRV